MQGEYNGREDTVKSAGIAVVVTQRHFFPQISSYIAWNDPRYGPCRSRHACGRYHSLLHPASLDDGLIRCYRVVPYDLLVAVRHWAQLPDGTHMFS